MTLNKNAQSVSPYALLSRRSFFNTLIAPVSGEIIANDVADNSLTRCGAPGVGTQTQTAIDLPANCLARLRVFAIAQKEVVFDASR